MTTDYAHILLIDNDGPRRNALAEQLQDLGYAVSTASAAEHPLALMSTLSFDLVILDVTIAGADQCALLRQARQEPALNQLPIILLATANQSDQVAQCLEQGATEYLLMPANSIQVKARINACLQHERLNERLNASWEAFREMERLANDLRKTILPLGIALSVEKDFDRLLEKIVVEAKKVCNADAGTLYLRTADDHLSFALVRTDSLGIAQGGATGQPVPFSPLPLYDEVTDHPNHRNIAAHVVLTGVSENLPNIYRASSFDFSDTKALDEQNNYRSVSCLTVPLKNQMNGVIGALQLLNAKNAKTQEIIPFDVYHQLVVESLASQAAVVLHNQILRKRQESLQEFQQQLQIGRQIQAGFFPEKLPQPPGWELVARFHPAREVAGDFYDSFPTPQGKIALVMADVCDKGVAAALFMSLVRSLIRAFSQQQYYLHSINDGEGVEALPLDTSVLLDPVRLTNTYIETNHHQSHMFATLFYGVLDPETGQLSYVNAGHNPPIVFNAAGIKTSLRPTGPAVGLREDATFDIHQVYLEPGDTLLAFTDGITEARNPFQQSFTTERLLSLLPSFAHSAAALLKQIDDQVHKHIAGAEPYDDIAMLAVRHVV